MELSDVVIFYDKQKGVCPICSTPLPNPQDENADRWVSNIDHDHACCPTDITCGLCIRGVLCRDCNLMIGHAKDNPDILKKAVEYLSTNLMKGSTQNL